jgi:hypothetical protein
MAANLIKGFLRLLMAYVRSEMAFDISKHPSIAYMQSCNDLFTFGTDRFEHVNKVTKITVTKAKVKIAPYHTMQAHRGCRCKTPGILNLCAG